MSGAVEVGARTEAGPRPENQDAVLAVELEGGSVLVAVADGMGGLGAGAEASRRVLERLEAAVRRGDDLVPAIHEAHRAVQALAETDAAGSTVVAALLGPDGVRLAHVGDSRAYQFGAMGLVPLTRDHTVAAEAEERGELAAREVAESRWGGTLSRALGSEGEVEVEVVDLPPVDAGGWLVLTSDGVHGPLAAEEIERLLAGAPTAASAAEELVRAALANGAEDNVSAVVVHRARVGASSEPVRRPAPRPPAPALDVPSGPARSEARPPTARRTRHVGKRGPARMDPRTLVARSTNRSPRRRWPLPGIFVTVMVVAVLLALFFILS
jgi:PPM family protein phosphatase